MQGRVNYPEEENGAPPTERGRQVETAGPRLSRRTPSVEEMIEQATDYVAEGGAMALLDRTSPNRSLAQYQQFEPFADVLADGFLI